MSQNVRTLARIALATGVYAAVHSLFASRQVKELAARKLGQRNRNGLYRTFYLAQSLGTGILLYLYMRRLPDRTLYQIQGSGRAALQTARIAALAYAVWAAKEVGIPGILGIRPLLHWLRGDPALSPEPEAQGPSGSPSYVRASGPFTLSRHPLNLVPLPIFWLRPKMTRNLLAFNVVMTAYMVLGSMHEEARLRAAYGPAYREYQASGVPFFLPKFRLDRSDNLPARVA